MRESWTRGLRQAPGGPGRIQKSRHENPAPNAVANALAKLSRASFRDQDRLWRIGMKIVEERIFAGVEGLEHEGRGRPGREHLLLAQLVAFEFGGRIAV